MSAPAHYSSTPPPEYDVSLPCDDNAASASQLRTTPRFFVGVLTAIAIVFFWLLPSEIAPDAHTTLLVFAAAIWFWVFTKIPPPYVALVAASAVILLDVISVESLFAPLGHETTWLLIGAFVVSTAIASSGVVNRGAVILAAGIRSPRSLVHLLTFATALTAFAIPTTTGRATLVLPAFLVVAATLPQWLQRILAVALPTVVLLSASASLIGAGAHLITFQVLDGHNLGDIRFTRWALFGLPYALVTSHLAAELIYLMLTSSEQRHETLSITRRKLTRNSPLSSRIHHKEVVALSIAVGTIALWFTESLHGIPAALVAVLAALISVSPAIGVTDFSSASKNIPWQLLLFMAATVALSQALSQSGAIQVLAAPFFGLFPAWIYIVFVILVATASHLLIEHRTTRVAVLVPFVIATAPVAGVNPAAAAFIATVAAGYCLTRPSSSSALAIFYGDDDNPRFTGTELFRLSAALVPMFLVVTVTFAFFVWPTLGLPLFM